MEDYDYEPSMMEEKTCEEDDDEDLSFINDEEEMNQIFMRLWINKYGNTSRDEMSRQLCISKAIKNDPNYYAENISWMVLSMGKMFPVYCRGKINDHYEVYRIYIHAAVTNNLSGPHYISIEEGEPFWVHSLTAMRKKFFQFEDFVSFERSSFLTFHHTDQLVPMRIKMLRQNIQLPTTLYPDRVFTQPDKFYFYSPQQSKEYSCELTNRSTQQIERLLFNIRQIYFRDKVPLPDKFLSI
jgi:hypothetical protein